MINIVLFYCQSRTGHFGQGSFVSSLLPSLEEDQDYKIILIKTDVREITSINYIETPRNTLIEIPPFPGISQIAGDSTIAQSNYAKYLIKLIYEYLFNLNNLIFWVNSIDYYNLYNELRTVFPKSKLLYVHHSFSWKYIINVTDDFFCKMWKDNSIKSNPLAYEMTMCQKSMVELCDVTITVTEHARSFFINILEIDPSKIVRIYNGIKIPDEENSRRSLLRRKYGFKYTDKIILFSGRITKDKGVVELFEAFKILAEKDSNFKLVMAGSGFFSEWLNNLAPFWNRVTFTGNINKTHLYNLYQLSDVGVLPSYHEQCSFTALEMSLNKLPMIVSDVDGLKELFTDQFDVLKIPIQVINNEKKIDFITLSNLVSEVIENKKLKKNLIKNAYKNLDLKFNIKKSTEEYKNLFKQLIRGSYQGHS